jgi:DNA transformation protein and related proteins
MATPSPFVEHVLDMLRDFGAVSAKPMFGAWGLYADGVFFALVAQDTLYLKADAASQADFAALELEPFVYESRVDEHIVTSYRRAPDEALENAQVMATWARRGLEAALRARGAKGSRRKRSPV